MPKDNKPKWKPARERINQVAITLRFDDDHGDDAAPPSPSACTFRSTAKARWPRPWRTWPNCTAWLMIHAAEANLYAGLTWDQIGQATGRTGQAAWQNWRYAPGMQDPIGAIRRRAKQERARARPATLSR